MSYDVFSRFYDSLTDKVEYEKRAEYFCGLLSMCRKEKGILLDLGCGTGGISIEAAKKGYDVIGVDISVGMLNEARRKAAESGVSLLLLNQSMDELDLYGTVDFALCVLDGINHLDDAEMVKRTFERVSLFMVPGGAFAFDVNTPSMTLTVSIACGRIHITNPTAALISRSTFLRKRTAHTTAAANI